MPTTCRICGKPLKKRRGTYYHQGCGRLKHRAEPVRDSDSVKTMVHRYLDDLPDGTYVKSNRLSHVLGLPSDPGSRSIVGRAISSYPRASTWGRRKPAAFILEGDV